MKTTITTSGDEAITVTTSTSVFRTTNPPRTAKRVRQVWVEIGHNLQISLPIFAAADLHRQLGEMLERQRTATDINRSAS
ncbi:hypothetical protein [Ferrovibrio sp.]|uniref:hypothetical protein n=1 Tax=Ferrovibrio sp. TaxID=1917215 RepID=UPI003D0D204B